MDVNREISNRLPALERSAGRIARRFGLRPHDADDLLSLGLLEASQRMRGLDGDCLPFYRGQAPFGAWLYYVVTRRMRCEAAVMRNKPDWSHAVEGGFIDDSDPPEHDVIERDERQFVANAIENLEDVQRSVMRMIYVDGITTRQAYRSSGVSWVKFRARHDAGLARLKQALQGAM